MGINKSIEKEKYNNLILQLPTEKRSKYASFKECVENINKAVIENKGCSEDALEMWEDLIFKLEEEVSMYKVFQTDEFGEVTVRNVMIEMTDNTTLSDGIEIKTEDGTHLEVPGYYDIDDIDEVEVIQLIENNYQ